VRRSTLKRAPLVLLVLLAGCSHKEEKETEAVVPVQAAAAQRAPIRRIVRAEAVLFPKNQAAITPKISAPVRQFAVNRGDPVRAGQVVALLENRDLAAAVAETKAQYEQAQAAYHATTAASLPEEVSKSELDAQAARQAFEAAQKLYQSREQLFKDGALARRLVDEAQVAFVQAKTQYETAQQHLAALKNVSRDAQTRGAAAQVEAAKSHYEAAVAQLGYSEIRSPIDGVVVDRPLYAGEMANAGTPLLTVMDTSRVVARANLPEREAAFVKLGDAATLAPGGAGKVTVVSPAVDPASTTVQVWVEAPNPGGRLKPGASVEVAITAATLNDAVVIPASALLPSNTVMVVGADSVAHIRNIETGVRDAELVQAAKGLEPGERVVTVGALGLTDGAKVRVEK
jgi:multidrug efflux pump subunit AcrA (membrane-fusion protein)